MNTLLNSISQNDETPIKKDSTIESLLNSEIGFDTCRSFKNNLSSFNTGFGKNNDLHYKTKCKLPKLHVPLYQENYLKEFVTPEEKAAARQALGIYTKGDVFQMSLFTAESGLPSASELQNADIKLMKHENKLFVPATSFKSVFDNKGITLEKHFNDLQQLISDQQKELTKINTVSKKEEITSLGDVRLFLDGFKNGDNLYNTVDSIRQDSLRFEKTGEITMVIKNNNLKYGNN